MSKKVVVVSTGINNDLMKNLIKSEDICKEFNIPMEVVTKVNDRAICTHCLGSGTVKAMQSATVKGETSIRYADTKVKCKYCNGIGLKEE